jgi:hypothetical protein
MFVGIFFIGFFLLSLVGCLYGTYANTISEPCWMIFYTLLIGWWVAGIPTIEFYQENIKPLS